MSVENFFYFFEHFLARAVARRAEKGKMKELTDERSSESGRKDREWQKDPLEGIFFLNKMCLPLSASLFARNAPNGNWFAEKPARRYCRRYPGYVRSCHRFVRRREL